MIGRKMAQQQLGDICCCRDLCGLDRSGVATIYRFRRRPRLMEQQLRAMREPYISWIVSGVGAV